MNGVTKMVLLNEEKKSKSFVKNIFSVQNIYENNQKSKVFTILGLKIKKQIPTMIGNLYQKLYAGNATYNDEKELLKELYKKHTGETLNIDNPQTFREKIQWLKLNWRDPKLTLCADKYKVREYIKDLIGEKYLTPLIGVYDKVEDIDFNSLPDKFVIKVNWGSGQNIIVTDKSKLDIQSVKDKLKKWINPKSNHYFIGLEWCYKNVEPKIIIEEYLESLSKSALDYKFMCFNSKPHYCWVSNKYLDTQERSFYDMQWNMQDIELVEAHKIKATQPIAKPDNLDEMIEIVNKLCQGFVHVRVDLYKLDDGTIKFGELTFMTSSGYSPWAPDGVDKMLGDLIDIEQIKKEGK